MKKYKTLYIGPEIMLKGDENLLDAVINTLCVNMNLKRDFSREWTVEPVEEGTMRPVVKVPIRELL